MIEDSLRILPMYGDKRFARANSGTLIVVAAPEEVFIINIRMKYNYEIWLATTWHQFLSDMFLRKRSHRADAWSFLTGMR